MKKIQFPKSKVSLLEAKAHQRRWSKLLLPVPVSGFFPCRRLDCFENCVFQCVSVCSGVPQVSNLTPRPSHSNLELPPSQLTVGSPEILALLQDRHPRPDPTPPSPRPTSGRWPCPPSAGNQSILAADMLAGCPRRSMRGWNGLGLRSTGQQAAASSLLEESTADERALIQPVTIFS